MAKTLFHRFTMAQNIRTLFNVDNLPVPLRPLMSIFKKTFKADIRGTLINDVLSFDENFRSIEEKTTWTSQETLRLREPVYHLLRLWITANDPGMKDSPILYEAYSRTSIKRLGYTFHTDKTSSTDCDVLFNKDGYQRAARISEIFSHMRQHGRTGKIITQTFAVVKPYANLKQGQVPEDPYREFSVLGGRLYRNTFRPEVLLNIGDICHFIRYPWSLNRFLALPIDRVRSLQILPDQMLTSDPGFSAAMFTMMVIEGKKKTSRTNTVTWMLNQAIKYY